MNRKLVFPLLSALAAGGLALFASACGSSSDAAPAGAKTVSVKLTDAGCEPHDLTVPAGPLEFEIENAGSASVTEAEVLDGETILGEKENLTEGLSGSFSLTLEKGTYTLRCNGGEEEDGTLTVTGEAAAQSTPKGEAAVTEYRGYLERNTAELVARTQPFVAAVLTGDLARAKALYVPARVPYERIEPVAESFGNLDPRIDARENDVPKGEWGGFHRIEKALWIEGTTKGMAPVARRLQADVEELAEQVETVELQATQIANGANELLGEVSASKITGEEERYSHTDLVDFEANVEGAQAAFKAVEPLLSGSDPELTEEIEADFAAAYTELKPYRRGDGFVPYTALAEADTRKLAQSIDVLAEKLSQAPAQIAASE
ncbi:MAG TPA: iron uptake system protein EfeO [Solirubrobacterales bacterium]|jgi:iron uptake system component EfeO|nr:iron uptake system protein EfeO [Solirubrobacterales bacterium]